ncbi:hypothetical protein CW357_05345 [Rummeliibacillus sp. TYF005]|uniref:hypothetical protein n=1 Tax=Rummeliibacillus sp. TYF005 TaxID=2058214 RepID=UPI000F545BA3|nr:hypothetical protein [Rummeliibacillus sp. TYF005]RPJ96326.1 hypothetical protein CW357_05345 [Rummeliibacillus sp. TYF005]
MDNRLLNFISIISFVTTIVSFLVCFLLYRFTNDTKAIAEFSNTGFIGYIFFILVFTAPLAGILFAILSKKTTLKPALILGNTVAFLTLALIVASKAFYDFI